MSVKRDFWLLQIFWYWVLGIGTLGIALIASRGGSYHKKFKK